MEVTSPTKRRVLGLLDPNASPKPRMSDTKPLANAPSSPLKRVTVFSASPSVPESNKRPLLFGELASDLLHPAKKACHEDNSRRDTTVRETCRVPGMQEQANPHDQPHAGPEQRQTASPEPSSLFDTSALDNSQATTITEPDLVAVTAAAAAAASALGAPPRSATRPRLTREEAREKAEILKLRLGLASYKLRTGQTDVPLEQLETRSFATKKSSRPAPPPPSGWASSRLQSQLRLQRAELARGSSSNSFSSSDNNLSATATIRRPLPGAPAAARGRSASGSSCSSGGDVAASYANASFSSQIQWSQSSAGEKEVGGSGDGSESLPQIRPSHAASLSSSSSLDQTPRRRLGVEGDEDRLTSSALRGGAVSGLLSLARS